MCGEKGVRLHKTMKFYVIHSFYLVNKHLQTCRAAACLPPKTAKIDVICGYDLYSVVGVDVPDDPRYIKNFNIIYGGYLFSVVGATIGRPRL